MNDFKPTPAALIDRLRAQVKALAAASSVDEQIAALFLLHCQIRDAEAMLPPVVAVAPAFAATEAQALPETEAQALPEAQGQEV